MKMRLKVRSLSVEASGSPDVLRSVLRSTLEAISPKVTPDPSAAAELERRRAALRESGYRPEGGFHADRQQARRG